MLVSVSHSGPHPEVCLFPLSSADTRSEQNPSGYVHTQPEGERVVVSRSEFSLDACNVFCDYSDLCCYTITYCAPFLFSAFLAFPLPICLDLFSSRVLFLSLSLSLSPSLSLCLIYTSVSFPTMLTCRYASSAPVCMSLCVFMCLCVHIYTVPRSYARVANSSISCPWRLLSPNSLGLSSAAENDPQFFWASVAPCHSAADCEE